MKILINRGNAEDAKNYPYWVELIKLLKEHEVKEIKGILQEQDIIDLVNWCDVWISIDSFLQHLVAYHKLKPGIVLWGTSHPAIFGYDSNVNLLKDKKYLRADPYLWWRDEARNPEAFVAPNKILESIMRSNINLHKT